MEVFVALDAQDASAIMKSERVFSWKKLRRVLLCLSRFPAASNRSSCREDGNSRQTKALWC